MLFEKELLGISNTIILLQVSHVSFQAKKVTVNYDCQYFDYRVQSRQKIESNYLIFLVNFNFD